MAIHHLQFQRPEGELRNEWFVDDDLNVLLDKWIADAASRSTDEVAQAWWVYYRAYGALARDFMIEPALQREGDAWEEIHKEQFAYFTAERDKALKEFNNAANVSPAQRSKTRRLVAVF
jgi:hypothetical protein